MATDLVKAGDVSVLDNTGNANQKNPNVALATVSAVSLNGATRETVRVDMGINASNVNDVVQFDITGSTGDGAGTELVRIGSWLALTGSYLEFGQTIGAADTTHGVADQFGTKVLAVQGFSKMTISNPMFIKEIHVISSDATQLNKTFSHKMIMPDFTILPATQNIAATQAKSDQRDNLNVATGMWLLSGRNFLEFSSLTTKNMSILLFIAAINDVAQFVPLGRA